MQIKQKLMERTVEDQNLPGNKIQLVSNKQMLRNSIQTHLKLMPVLVGKNLGQILGLKLKILAVVGRTPRHPNHMQKL